MTSSCLELVTFRDEASIGSSAMVPTGKGLQNPDRTFESHRRI